MLKNLIILILLTVSIGTLKAQQTPVLVELQPQTTAINAKEYFITAIADKRNNKTLLGRLQPYALPAPGVKAAYSIGLKGGSAALANFLQNSVKADKSLRPVIVTVRELTVSEDPAVNGVVKGSVKVNVSFALKKPYDPLNLTDYITITTYQRHAGPAQYMEPILRNALTNALIYFDNWMNSQAATNIKLAREVKLTFIDYSQKSEGDTIYYSAKRPLIWKDFTGTPTRRTQHAAEIFSGIAYDEDSRIKSGVVEVKISLKAWAAKSACWVAPGMESDYALNHEQRHFDLTRLAAEHFKRRLLAQKLPVDSFEGEINMAYLDAIRDMNSLQKRYDDETSHSRNTGAQYSWDKKIDSELAELNIK